MHRPLETGRRSVHPVGYARLFDRPAIDDAVRNPQFPTMPMAIADQFAPIRVRTKQDLDARFVAAWEDLASRCLEPNLFLTPSFVLPALEHLTPNLAPVLVAIESSDRTELHGLGIFVRSRGSRHMPLDYYYSYRCPHTFRTGMLFDVEHAGAACEHFFRFARSGFAGCYAVEFRQLATSTCQGTMMFDVAKRLNLDWCELDRYERAFLDPEEVNPDTYLNDVLSYKRRGEVRRSQRRLQDLGDVRFIAHEGDAVDRRVVDAFLVLENNGWKGQSGSSLLANPAHKAFFCELVRRCSENHRVVFTELQLDGTPIGSTANFIVNDVAFAFKFGWDTSFEKLSLGILQAVTFATHSPEIFKEVRCIDSCTERDSFVQKLWPRTQTIASGFFATSPLARICWTAVQGLRNLRRRLRRW